MSGLKPTAEIEELARQLAEVEGRDVNAAVAQVLRDALAQRRGAPRPIQSAQRLRAKYGVELTEQARKPLAQSAYDELGPNL
jgi:antitoxin VapB